MNARAGELRRGWPVILGAMLGIAFGLGPLGFSYTLSMFVKPLQDQFGWSLREIMLVPTILSGPLLASSLVFGRLADKYDVRWVAIPSLLALSLTFVILGTVVNSLAGFYACYLAMALFAAGSLPASFTRPLVARFVRHRGLAMGIALSGFGLAAIVAPSYLGYILPHYGWRAGYLALAVLPVLIAIPASLLLRGRPVVQAVGTGGGAPEHQPGLTFRQALADRNFWLLGLSAILASIAVTGTLANFVGIARGRGISLDVVAMLQSLFGLSAICGRVVVGLLLDRYRVQAIGVLFFAPAGLAALCLSFHDMGLGGVALAFALIGLATGAEVDLCAYATSRYFGPRAYSRVFATLFQMLVIGGGIAAPLFGWMYDFTGSYSPMLATAAACHLAAAGLVALLGRYPDWQNGDERD